MLPKYADPPELVPPFEVVNEDRIALQVRSYLGFAGPLRVYSEDLTVYVYGEESKIAPALELVNLKVDYIVLNDRVYVFRGDGWVLQ